MFWHGFNNATVPWVDTIHNPKAKDEVALMKFDKVLANLPIVW